MITSATQAPDVPLFVELLLRAAADIDIPQSRYDRAAEHYRAVGEFLKRDGSILRHMNPLIYAQGSVALGTAIRPPVGDDFDIDLACQLVCAGMDPMALRNRVALRLKEDERYRRMLDETKNRCLRLDYSKDEGFHLDIIAARFAPETSPTGTALLVPDQSIRNWTSSDPKGYIAWFERRKKIRILEKFATSERATVEPIPDLDRRKSPLQVCVQLLKRNRDLHFQRNMDMAPASIVITTLAAKVYDNSADVPGALHHIVVNLEQGFDSAEPAWVLLNPTNSRENFTDRWQQRPELAEAFFAWLRELRRNVVAFSTPQTFNKSAELLEQFVGRASRDAALKTHAGDLSRSQTAGQLFATAGAMSLTTRPARNDTPIGRHTNFGGG